MLACFYPLVLSWLTWLNKINHMSLSPSYIFWTSDCFDLWLKAHTFFVPAFQYDLCCLCCCSLALLSFSFPFFLWTLDCVYISLLVCLINIIPHLHPPPIHLAFWHLSGLIRNVYRASFRTAMTDKETDFQEKTP